MWVHESFANYAEALYTECQYGQDGRRARTSSAPAPSIAERPARSSAAYGVNDEGSGDMYYKGGNMLHTIRQVVGDDEKWRGILRGLNQTFRHQTVTGAQVQDYISAQAGDRPGQGVRRSTSRRRRSRCCEYRLDGSTLSYRWANVVPGFDMPVRVLLAPSDTVLLRPTTTWQSTPAAVRDTAAVRADPDFFVITRQVAGPPRTP